MRYAALCFLLFSAAGAWAQATTGATAEPQVNADSTVTFRYAEPSAAKVGLVLDGTRQPLPMERGPGGLWVVTTPALAPEYYGYHFNVDGSTQLDARNPTIRVGYTGAGNGFLVPGTPAEPWEQTAVPHGIVHHHTFTTHVVRGLDGNQDEFYVYTPPGYDPRATTKYPVLYLLHGWSDTANGWTSIGRANDILDNLIAGGRARPMIVVMPLGYGDMSFVRNGFGVWRDPAAIEHNRSLFEQSLLTEVIPQVEALYNTATDSKNRAIAGLSMGGLESVTIGLANTNKFAWIGGFSSAVYAVDPATLPHVPAASAPRLLWIACGTSDDLLKPNRALIAGLSASGLKVTPIETPGAHTWLVWRDNLVHFAPLLFQ
jgi:enterochelin esterase-like enzyme